MTAGGSARNAACASRTSPSVRSPIAVEKNLTGGLRPERKYSSGFTGTASKPSLGPAYRSTARAVADSVA